MLEGKFKHKDSKGNEGLLVPGGVQWMTAGKGLLHSEMPAQKEGHLWGFQLWVNLPAAEKMKEPRYQDLKPEDIPVVETDKGVRVRVIAGEVAGVPGPIDGVSIKPTLLDVKLPSGESFEQEIPDGHTLFIYGIEGESRTGNFVVPPGEMAIFQPRGDAFKVSAQEAPARFLVVSGAPINEPIARYGPFVMNTHEEILQTLRDFKSGNY
jgi:redox-sensitive bicupin YhaK (pirin superfamily)